MPLEKRLFTSGMDQDSDERLVESTSYRYALNVRSMSADGSNIGAIENVKGNTLVSYTLPSGTNKVIGSFDYKVYNKVYYFVYNSASDHSILEYNATSNSIAKVLQNSVLNFDPAFLITGINVVELDLNNHLLYWTDNNEEPKKINIEKGKFHSAGNFTQGYTSPFLAEFIYRIKTPQVCEPICAYANDATKNINLLTNKLFQFKVQYVYDDFEKSATSPISLVALPDLICQNNPAPFVGNNIQVTVDTGSTIVARIKILAREGNTGDFFEIADLDKALLTIASNSTYTYAFYNDKVYNTIDINESIKLFDNVPLKSQAQELIEGERIVDGNILEGFDPVTPNARIDLALEDDPSSATYGFAGQVYIGNFFDGSPRYQYGQPIHQNGSNGNIVFGGFGKNHNLVLDGVVNNIDTDYKQTLPLGGFVFYLAGTNYYAISQQISPATPDPDLEILSGGVFNSDTRKHKNAIRQSIEFKEVFSQYTFSGVPAGKYILRVASHLTTRADLQSGNLDWQKTSTNCLVIGGDKNYECEIEIVQNIPGGNNLGYIKTATGIVANGNLIGTSEVMDLTDPNLLTGSQAITGYVTDKDIASPAANTTAYLEDTRIELAKVSFSHNGLNFWNALFGTSALGIGLIVSGAIDITQKYKLGYTFTDHNGYFYFTHQFLLSAIGNLSVSGVASGGYTISGGTLSQLAYSNPPTSFSNPSGSSMSMGIFRNADSPSGTNGNIQNYSRTVLNGNIKYNGIGATGMTAISSRGGIDSTDVNGDFGLIVYADTLNGTQRNDTIIYGISDNCIVTFNTQSDAYMINIASTSASQSVFSSPYNGTYDYSSQLALANIIITSILGDGSTISFKRGSVEQFGIVYYDHANRSGLTNTNDASVLLDYTTDPAPFTTQNGLKLEIPFFTNTDPNTGLIWGKSKPIVSWNVFHQPPVWATHWQWVRTLNSVPNRYLQWTAKGVAYTDNDRNVTSRAQATKIGINISNIVDYKTKFNDSQVTYVPEIGDRIRFIKDGSGVLFSNYIDLLIRDIDSAGSVYVDNSSNIPDLTLLHGFLFEIYTPKLQSSTSIYYEFGQCYEVGNPGLSTRYHKGNDQDQSFINLSFTTFSNAGRDPVFFSVPKPNTLSDGEILNIDGTSFQVIVSNINNSLSTTYTTFQSNLLFSSGNVPTSGTFSVAATGIFSGGDTFNRIRTIPPGNNNWYIEDASFSDFFKSKVQDIGRPNKVDNTARQIRRKSTIYYSDKFVPETKINGLSSVFDTSFETYEAQYGGIQKLFNQDLQLDCYQELKVGAIPVNQVQFQSTAVSGSNVVGASDNVLNPIRYYQGEYGISLNPESFAQYGGARYFFDLNRGVVLRLSNDGLTVISDYKMRNYFSDKSTQILRSSSQPKIYGVFDADFKEYILAFEAYTQILPAPVMPVRISGETLAFNEKYNAWSTFYSYLPDNMATSGVGIVTFRDGNIYTHNTNSTYNNFYNTQYSSEAWVICNGEPSKDKVLSAISEECPEVWEVFDILTQNGQSTNLIASDFEEKQNMQYGGLLRDVNTPNVTNPLIEGQIMVDTSFLIKLRNSSTAFVKLFAVNAFWEAEERSNK